METSLFYRLDEKRLKISLRQKLESDGMVLKFKGALDTVKGFWYHNLKFRRSLLSEVSHQDKAYRYRRFSRSFIDAGIGAEMRHLPHRKDDYVLGLWGRVQQAIGDMGDIWARADATLMYNKNSKLANLEMNARINKVIPNITSRQDCKITIGCDINYEASYRNRLSYNGYIELKENNWGLRIDHEKYISLTYHL